MAGSTKLNKDGLNKVWLKVMELIQSLTGNVDRTKGTLQEQIDVKATSEDYGRVKVTNSSAVTDSTGLALAATEKNASIDGTLAKQINELNSNLTANYPLKTQIINQNLLDNPWFTVNQRGTTNTTINSSSPSNVYGYFMDRYIIRIDNTNGSATFNLSSKGFEVVCDGANRAGFISNVSDKTFGELGLVGKTVTYSINIIENCVDGGLNMSLRYRDTPTGTTIGTNITNKILMIIITPNISINVNPFSFFIYLLPHYNNSNIFEAFLQEPNKKI